MIEHAVYEQIVSEGIADTVHPAPLESGETLPAITYSREETEEPWAESPDGQSSVQHAEFQFDVWDREIEVARAKGNLLKAVFYNYKGPLGTSAPVRVLYTRFFGLLDVWEDDVQAFRRSLRFVFTTEG